MKRVILILIFAGFLTACGGGGGGGGAAPSVNSDDSRIVITDTQKEEALATVNSLRSDLDSLENNAEANSLRQEIDALIADINAARHTIEELQNEIANLRSEIDTLKVAETQTEPPPLNCGANEEIIGGSCECISGYVQQNGACELPPPNCGANEEESNGICKCISGYVQQNGVCELPPPNCGINEIADGQNCVCVSGYVRKNNICEPEPPPLNCGTNEEIIGGSCECISGYVRQNGVCELPPLNCGANEEIIGGNCECISGYVRKNNICEPESPLLNCGANEKISGQNCVCVDGYRLNANGACICIDSSRRNANGMCEMDNTQTNEDPPPNPEFYTAEYRSSKTLLHTNPIPAYEARAFGQGVTVIVLEGSYRPTHEDLAANVITTDTTLRRVSGRYSTNRPHGNIVAGVLGAEWRNGKGAHGIAPSVKMWLTGYNTNKPYAQQHIPFAIENSIAIVNRSHHILGSTQYPSVEEVRTKDFATEYAAKYAAAIGDADIVEVFGAGNVHFTSTIRFLEGVAGHLPHLQTVVEKNVLIVANIDENNELNRTSADCSFAKRWCLSAYGSGDILPGAYTDTHYVNEFTGAGTSASAPVVSGALALLKSAAPEIPMTVIRQILLTTTTDLGDEGIDEVYGWGAVNISAGIDHIENLEMANGMAYSDLRKSLPGEFSHLRGRLSEVSVALKITDDSYYNIPLSDIVGGGDSQKTSLGNAAKEMQADDSLSPENSGFGFNYANGDYDLHYASGGGNENAFRFSGGLRHDDSQSSYIGEGSSPFAAANASDTGGYVKWTTKNYGGISAFGEYGRTQIKADYDSNSFVSKIQNARAEEWTAGFQYRNLFLHNDNLQFSARQESRISGGEMVLHYPVADGDSHKAFIGESVQTIRTETAKIPIKQKPQTIYTAGYSQKTENSKWSAAAEWNAATNAKGFSFAVELQIR